MACKMLVPQPGMEPMPPAVEMWSLNHWTTREVPVVNFQTFPSSQKETPVPFSYQYLPIFLLQAPGSH